MDQIRTPFSVFLDLSKAFDTLNHHILLSNLEYYGMRSTALQWFKSYLTERQQFVEYPNVCSSTRELETGVPQGSIWGPLVFLYMWKIYVLWVTNWISFYTLTILHLPVHYVHYTPSNEVSGGYIGFTLSVCLSPSVRLSVCPLTFGVRPVASTVQGGFFPYLVQMINSMRGCVACDDPWPWPISSRSFGLDLENRVRSVSSTVLDGFFLYFA